MFNEETRIGERRSLFTAIVDRLEADSRIVGAWHFGSMGKGTSDFLSDIDLVSIVDDAAFGAIVDERYDFVRQFGEVVLTVEQPMNGPSGGVYLMSGYDCPTGLQLVDWYWQPRSHSPRPKAETVIFLREELPEEPAKKGERFVAWQCTEESDPPNVAALAWAMIAIQAKYVYRKPGVEPFDFAGFIVSLIDKAIERSTNFGNLEEAMSQEERFKRLRAMAETLEFGCPTYSRPADSVVRLLGVVG